MLPLLVIGLLAWQDPDVDALLKQLEDESVEVREKAIADLIDLGPKAEAKVRARAQSADATLRVVCERILAVMAVPKELRKAVPPLRRVTIDAQGRKLREVLDDFQNQSGITLTADQVGEGEVTVQVKDTSPLQALVAVCKAAGLTYYFDAQGRYQRAVMGGPPGMKADGDKSTFRITRGTLSDVPRQFIRHYLVEPTNLSLTRSTNFQAGTSTGQLSLRIVWLPGMEPDSVALNIESIADDAGRSLVLVRPEPEGLRRSSMSQSRAYGGWPQGDHAIQIVYPEADARTIASVKGRVILSYVVGEKTVAFESPSKLVGEKREHAGQTVELVDWKEDGGTLTAKFTITGKGRDPQDPYRFRMDARHFRMKTEDGSTPMSQGWGGSGGGESYTVDLRFGQVKSKIVSVEVVMETQYAEDKVEFELKDIPLPK